MNIAIVEDDDNLRDVLVEAISDKDFWVLGFESVEDFVEKGHDKVWSLIILDISLPGESGLDFAKHYREINSQVGIIILSANNSLRTKIQSYDAGVDQYITKPIHIEELKASIKAFSKRLYKNKSIDVNSLSFNQVEMTLTFNGQRVLLNRDEYQIISYLILSPESKVESWQLLELLGYELDKKGKKHLEVTISRLRTKIYSGLGLDNVIGTIHGVGYRLTFDIAVLS